MKEASKVRIFSEAFKKEKVKLIENRQFTVKQLSRIYEVSETAIYKWIRKYSTKIAKSEKIVIEKESEGAKTLELLKQIAELERTIGQKQLEIDYLEKVIELGNEEVGFDIKKKYASGRSHGSVQ
jgi:transposase-like protein